MSITEFIHQHITKDFQVNFTKMRETISHKDKRISKIEARSDKVENPFGKNDSVVQRQDEKFDSALKRKDEKIDERLDASIQRCEHSMNVFRLKVMGLVSYSHYPYSTSFSKGNLLQLVLDRFWLSNRTSQGPKPPLYYQYPAPPPGFTQFPAQATTSGPLVHSKW